MSTFEILILVLVAFFVCYNFVFCLVVEKRNKKMADYDSQIKVLTTRIGEVSTENVRVNTELRKWIDNYNRVTVAYNDMQKERDEAKRELESLKKKKPVKKDKEEIINE